MLLCAYQFEVVMTMIIVGLEISGLKKYGLVSQSCKSKELIAAKNYSNFKLQEGKKRKKVRGMQNLGSLKS